MDDPPIPSDQVVAVSIRWSALRLQYFARITVQEQGSGRSKYVKHIGYFNTFSAVLAWYATFA